MTSYGQRRARARRAFRFVEIFQDESRFWTPENVSFAYSSGLDTGGFKWTVVCSLYFSSKGGGRVRLTLAMQIERHHLATIAHYRR